MTISVKQHVFERLQRIGRKHQTRPTQFSAKFDFTVSAAFDEPKIPRSQPLWMFPFRIKYAVTRKQLFVGLCAHEVVWFIEGYKISKFQRNPPRAIFRIKVQFPCFQIIVFFYTFWLLSKDHEYNSFKMFPYYIRTI